MRRVQAARHGPLLGILAMALITAACGGQPAITSSLPSASAVPTDSPSPEPAVQATFEPAEAAPAGAVTVAVNNDNLKFHPEELTVAADSAVFFVVHDGEPGVGTFRHNFQIGPELPPGTALVSSPTLDPGESVVYTVTGLEPGEYQFWCSFMEHNTHGMVGTLTVTP